MLGEAIFSGFGYSTVSKLLDIQFTGGEVYRYSEVFDGAFYDLLYAPSQGMYFNTYIRDVYAYTGLE